MEIPYTVDERPDTGVYNAKLGVWLFLASEVMLFGGLFSAYVFLRLGADVGAFHEWGQELNIPLVVTNDCHYCVKSDSNAHDALFCLGTGKDVNDANRMKYEPEKFYVKSADEMYQIFKDVPEALENTLAVAEQCDVEIPLGNYHLPAYPLPDEETNPDKYLEKCN